MAKKALNDLLGDLRAVVVALDEMGCGDIASDYLANRGQWAAPEYDQMYVARLLACERFRDALSASLVVTSAQMTQPVRDHRGPAHFGCQRPYRLSVEIETLTRPAYGLSVESEPSAALSCVEERG